MPRKKQVVQRKRRQKTYATGESAAPLDLTPKGAFRVFHNYRLFAVIGTLVMIAGLGITSAFLRGSNGTPSNVSPRGQGVVRTTPEAGSTATSSQSNVKQYSAAPAMSIDPNKSYTAVIKTDKGTITVQLDAKAAPQTVNNFVFLAKDGYYKDSPFYRVIADASGHVDFVQAGDPTGLGTGGPGYTLPIENTVSAFDSAGVLAMAKPQSSDQPNNGSQFFITTAPLPTFDGRYTVFGKVVSGLDVLKQLQPRDPQLQQQPSSPALIQSIDIQAS